MGTSRKDPFEFLLTKNSSSRKITSSKLLAISIATFALAVLASQIPGYGTYVSLALVVLGGFGMLVIGIHSDSVKARSKIRAPDELEEDNLLA
jgi:hypothetical protein